ncbi:protein of unknown function [Candidatus Hydrogenisulfobacillus filiaventi]|uniref:Uncharacterized protein n=1 Tax=Candidatus Hydrogenisulfobacillus filiaventi TaxID=2707344 RepID=A0A6F8ZI76_9FIRM|nr:protein of unknown function [Candidatus Hydrogenisulfobacillus filiaventi]
METRAADERVLRNTLEGLEDELHDVRMAVDEADHAILEQLRDLPDDASAELAGTLRETSRLFAQLYTLLGEGEDAARRVLRALDAAGGR